MLLAAPATLVLSAVATVTVINLLDRDQGIDVDGRDAAGVTQDETDAAGFDSREASTGRDADPDSDSEESDDRADEILDCDDAREAADSAFAAGVEVQSEAEGERLYERYIDIVLSNPDCFPEDTVTILSDVRDGRYLDEDYLSAESPMELSDAAQQACDETDWGAHGDVRDHLRDAAWQVADRFDLDRDDVWIVATSLCPPSEMGTVDQPPSNRPSDRTPAPDDANAWRAQITECGVDSRGFAQVRGEVANDSSRMRSYSIQVVLDGANNLRAGSGLATASSIPPGGVGQFSFQTSVSSVAGGVSSCRIESVWPN